MVRRRVGVIAGGILSLGLLFFGDAAYVHASNFAYGDGNYGACTYNVCAITLTTSGTVNLNIVPTGSGACTIQKDVVGVTTDSSTGYSLTLGDSDTSNNLAGASHGSHISAGSGTQASPAALTANTWGYRVDNVGSFGGGPTSANTNIAIPSTTFAAIPLSSQTADTLANSSSPADPTVNTNVWYGACADTTIPDDTYSDVVTYTAVIN